MRSSEFIIRRPVSRRVLPAAITSCLALLGSSACSDDDGSGGGSGTGGRVSGSAGIAGDGDAATGGGGGLGSDSGTGGNASGGNDGTGGDGNVPSAVSCSGTTPLATGSTGVYFEIESVQAVGDWTEETAVDGYLGESYFQWIDEKVNAPAASTEVLRYCFAIETPGTYLMEFRGRRDRDLGTFCETSANDGCNDVWIQVDGEGAFHDGEQQEWTKKMIKPPWGEWGWNDRWDPQNGAPKPIEIVLEAGAHELGVHGRSHRVKLDAVRIWLDGTEPPDE